MNITIPCFMLLTSTVLFLKFAFLIFVLIIVIVHAYSTACQDQMYLIVTSLALTSLFAMLKTLYFHQNLKFQAWMSQS